MTKDSKHSIARLALALAGGLAATSALAIKITIGGGGDARDVDLKAAYDFTADPATTAATYIVPRGTPKNVQKVAIASLCVSVADARSVTGDSGPFTASASTPFPGTLDSARLAEVLDGFRKQLVADLRAGGITVLEPGELAALPSFQKLAAKADFDFGQYVAPGVEQTSFTFSGKNGGGTLWLKQAIVAGDNPFVTGDTTRKKTETKLNNEYDIDSGTTTTSGSKTMIGANMDLWYSNSANSLKALSGMLVHALKNPK